MSEYTKEQEAEALERYGRYVARNTTENIVLAMAKRTAEAEREASILAADCHDASCMACAKCCDALTAERDALKARVAELEAKAAQSPFDPSVDPADAAQGIAEIQRAMASVPPVVVTREMVEALVEFAESLANWRYSDGAPLNAAADTAVAWRKALEVKP